MGNSAAIRNHPNAPRHDYLARSVEKLAKSLGVSKHLLATHSLRFPDGSLHYTPRIRWCLLIKAIIECFCPIHAPGGVVFYIGDAENRVAHLESGGLAKLGVVLDPAAKVPDVIVHYRAKNWLLLIEAVASDGPVDDKRRKELKDLFAGCHADLVFITAFENRRTMQAFILRIAMETDVWVAEDPKHMINLNRERVLGYYPDVMRKLRSE